MSRSHPSHVRFLCWALLVGAGMFGVGRAVAAAAPDEAAEITFETTSPYYQPKTAVVSAGIPVRWINHTASPHSVRHDGCLSEELCAFQSIAVPPDSSFLVAPLPPGRYAYHCELHPIMRGTLVVVDPMTKGDAMLSALEPDRSSDRPSHR